MVRPFAAQRLSPGYTSVAIAALVVLLAYVSATPGTLLAGALDPLGWLGHFGRLYMKPVVLGAALLGFWAGRRSDSSGLRLSLACAALGLIYVAVDALHYGAAEGIVQLAKDALYNKVAASFFVACLTAGILAAAAEWCGAPRVAAAVIASGNGFALLSVLVWVAVRRSWLALGDHGVTQNNFQAYEVVGLMLLALFFWRRVLTDRLVLITIGVGTLIPLLHSSRGGMLTAAYLLAGWVVLESRANGWRAGFKQRTTQAAAAACVLLALGLSGVLGAGHSAAARGGDSASSPRLMTELRALTLAREFRHNRQSNSEISTSDDVVSAYSRIGTTILALKAFAQSPLVGIGIWDAYANIEVANFGIHGLLPLLLAGYGLLGVIPMLGVMAFAGFHRMSRQPRLHLAIALGMVAMLFNIYPWWLGAVLWAAWCESRAEWRAPLAVAVT